MAAAGLDGLADFLGSACKEAAAETFKAEPFYEPHTDSLIYYLRDESSYAKRVTKYLTLFLANSNDSLVGIEIKGLQKSILPAIDGMGIVDLNEPLSITDGDGNSFELSVVARFAMASAEVKGEDYDELNRLTKGVRVSGKPQPCA